MKEDSLLQNCGAESLAPEEGSILRTSPQGSSICSPDHKKIDCDRLKHMRSLHLDGNDLARLQPPLVHLQGTHDTPEAQCGERNHRDWLRRQQAKHPDPARGLQ